MYMYLAYMLKMQRRKTMNKLFKLTSVLLILAMLFTFAACTGTDTQTPSDTDDSKDTTSTDTTPSDKYADIAGEYLLDGSNLGMPMKWYIKVTADGKFQIATQRDYATLKGEGTIGDKDGTYLLYYSDSTAESPKTATFTFEGKNMVFSTNIPIGSASLSPNVDEGKYPTAKFIANEDILGTYLGTFEKASQMGNVVYDYSLVLSIGNEFAFSSSFVMMGETYTRTENGTFDVADGKITFTSTEVNGEKLDTAATVEGTIADKAIKVAFKLSDMASAAQEIEAKLGVYADIAGTYVGLYEKQMGMMKLSYATVLTLDAFGGYEYYTYDATTSEADYSEKGTYTYADGKFSFTSEKEGATAVEGTYASYVISVKFPISAAMSTPVDLTFYAEEVSGAFMAITTEEGVHYAATLELAGNQFVMMVGIYGEDAPKYVAVGTFEIKSAMMTTLSFTTTAVYTDMAMENAVTDIPAELKTISAPVAESGINAELLFDLDDAKLVGFQLSHEMPELPEIDEH